MADDNMTTEIATIKGDLKALDRRTDDRFRLVDKRLDEHDEWIEDKSAPFHKMVEQFIIRDETEKRIEKELAANRHTENQLEISRNSLQLIRNNNRIAIWGVIGTVLATICAICMVYLAWKAMTRASVDPSEYFRMDAYSSEYAAYSSPPLVAQGD